MKCEKCGIEIEKGEEREYVGRILCEDCYMDALSPVRTCDPWAVYTAKKSGDIKLTEIQKKILRLIDERGGLSMKEIAESLNLSISDVEREIAALRHMEKIRAAMKNSKKVIVRW